MNNARQQTLAKLYEYNIKILAELYNENREQCIRRIIGFLKLTDTEYKLGGKIVCQKMNLPQSLVPELDIIMGIKHD